MNRSKMYCLYNCLLEELSTKYEIRIYMQTFPSIYEMINQTFYSLALKSYYDDELGLWTIFYNCYTNQCFDNY